MTQRQALQRRRPRRRHPDGEADMSLANASAVTQQSPVAALRQVQMHPTAEAIHTLQRAVGNSGVQRLLANGTIQREEADPDDPYAEEAPESKLGYLGFNPDAKYEAAALKGKLKDEAIIALNDPTIEKTLETNEGIAKWVLDHLITDILDQIPLFLKATDTLEKTDPAARDMMAQAMLMFASAERGDYVLERLVLSGHSNGVELWGDDAKGHKGGKFLLDKDLVKLAEAFPGAAAQVQDIMFSACYSANSILLVSKVFPNLQNAWGYLGFSPSARGGAVGHIDKFVRNTEGDQALEKQDGAGASALWTRDAADAGGTGFIRNDIADMDVKEIDDAYDEMKPYFDEQFEGTKPIDDTMNGFYSLLQYRLMHPGTADADRKLAEQQREIVLRMRYWSRVTLRFGTDYKDMITKAYGAVGRAVPNFGGMSRSKVKAELEAFAEKLADTPDAAAQQFVNKYLYGLWTLIDTDVIPSTWI